MVELGVPGLQLDPSLGASAGGVGAGASALGGMSAILMAVQAVGGAYATYEQQRAQRAIEKVRRRIIAARAQEAEARVRQRGNKVVGAQRASMAAQGIRLDVGSAQDVQEETKTVSELDALTIKNNALAEAYGFQTQSGLGSRVAQTEALDTLLAGGLKAYQAYKTSY